MKQYVLLIMQIHNIFAFKRIIFISKSVVIFSFENGQRRIGHITGHLVKYPSPQKLELFSVASFFRSVIWC